MAYKQTEVTVALSYFERFMAGETVRQPMKGAQDMEVGDVFPWNCGEHHRGMAQVSAIDGDVVAFYTMG